LVATRETGHSDRSLTVNFWIGRVESAPSRDEPVSVLADIQQRTPAESEPMFGFCG
jgi:hypothetical protein